MEKFKVGYTTGVYDMFHIGHLNLLRRAKELCDFLIVGVSTDELVDSYKHKIPIIPFEERIAIVESIKYVDMVVPQETMDKFLAWENYHFDVMFHGVEWKGSDMYNKYEKELQAVGSQVVYFEPTKGVSSSLIRKKINR